MKATIKRILKNIPVLKDILKTTDNQQARDTFVRKVLESVPAGKLLLDAGCGSQRYREFCKHLIYKAQDFGQFKVDETPSMSAFKEQYQYGKIDYQGDIWCIAEKDATFDVVLCTEVFEHIPYPNETIREFARLLKKGGTLILTAPANCLRHMDPYYFYSGFSNRWFEKILAQNGFRITALEVQGDYHSWMRAEMQRAMSMGSWLAKVVLFPAFVYFSLRRPSLESTSTLCEGYHIVAVKQN